MRKLLVVATMMVSMCVGHALQAADYPKSIVRIVYPGPAGNAGDIRIRRLAEALSSRLGARFVVDNRPGAAGAIAAAFVARAPADGHTLLAVINNFVTTPSVMKNPGYDPLRDFTPVGSLLVASPILVVNATSPVRSIQEFMNLAKARPEAVSLAHGGLGGSNHMPAVMFEHAAGLEVLHVAYKGEAPALVDVIGGQVTGIFSYLPILLPQIQAGKLRPLAVTMSKRNPALPDVPTLAESGLAGFEYHTWLGLVAPTGTPRSAIDILNREIRSIMNSPEMSEDVRSVGSEVYAVSPDEFGAVIRRDADRYGKQLRKLGIVPE